MTEDRIEQYITKEVQEFQSLYTNLQAKFTKSELIGKEEIFLEQAAFSDFSILGLLLLRFIHLHNKRIANIWVEKL